MAGIAEIRIARYLVRAHAHRLRADRTAGMIHAFNAFEIKGRRQRMASLTDQ